MQQATKVKPRPQDTLCYPYADPPMPAGLREVAPGAYWLRMPLPFALEHINLWLLADGDSWTIVDCGFGTDETRALWQKIFAEQLGGKPVTRVVVTHFIPIIAAWQLGRPSTGARRYT